MGLAHFSPQQHETAIKENAAAGPSVLQAKIEENKAVGTTTEQLLRQVILPHIHQRAALAAAST